MQQSFPFQPRANNQTTPACQASLAVTNAVQQVTIPGAPFNSETTLRIVIEGSVAVAWAYGAQSGLLTSNGCFMLAGTVETFQCPAGVSQLSAIASGAGSNLRVHIGDGQ